MFSTSTTTFGTGTADLEDMLEDLNYKSGTYLFKISAILTDGRATVVIIHDWNETEGEKGEKPVVTGVFCALGHGNGVTGLLEGLGAVVVQQVVSIGPDP